MRSSAATTSSARSSVLLGDNVQIGAGQHHHGTTHPRHHKNRTSLVSVVEENVASSQLQQALPVLYAQNTWDKLMDWFRGKSSAKSVDDEMVVAAVSQPPPPRVSMLTLLSHSTCTERLLMFLGLVVAGIAGLCLPAWLVLLARSLDTFASLARLIEAGGDVFEILQREMLRLCVAFAVLGIVSLVSGFIYVSIWTYTGSKQSVRIQKRFVKAALRQDAAWFDANNRDALPTSMANSMIYIRTALGRNVADLFANTVSAAGSLAVALILNAPLAIVMLCVVPVVATVMLLVGCLVRRSSRKASESFVAAGALATEAIAGIKTVASLCAERWALTQYARHIKRGQGAAIVSGFWTGLMAGLTGLLFYATYCVAFWIGTEQVKENMQIGVIIRCFFSTDPNCRITGAAVMCCIYGVILCATFVGLMAPGLQAVNLGRQAAGTVFATMRRKPTIDASAADDINGGVILDDLTGAITFDKVYFSYPSGPQRPIFTNFQLSIAPGQSVAFVGPSGSGKSTITKLLLRFYDPVAGTIRVGGRNNNGEPLDTLNVKWWRQQVGYVAQTPLLFPGTLFYNIACGDPTGTATKERVIQAAKAACAHEFIETLPAGYDTFYSGVSIQLSGGQMQRICIARAILRDPTILLLDEATSALDTNSEKQVQNALNQVRRIKRVTTITVAHRLSTIVDCDQIAVISDGGIAELGKHRDLLELGGIYAGLCESQGITLDSKFTTAADSNDSHQNSHEGTTGTMNGSIVKFKGVIEGDIETGQQHEEVEAIPEEALATATTKREEQVVEDEEEQDQYVADPFRLWSLNKPEWGYLILGTLAASVVGALPPVEGILTARIVANFYTVKAENLLEENRKEILAFLALGCASLVANTTAGFAFSVSGFRLTGRMRSLVFESMLRRNAGWFDVPEHSVGELTTRLESDAEALAKVTGWALGYRVRVFASLTAGVAIALAFSWIIGLVAIACVPLIMAAALVQKCFVKGQKRKHLADEELLSPETIFEQGLRGIDAVQSYGLEGRVSEDYDRALEPQAADHVRNGVVAGLVYGLSQFAVFGSFAILFYVATLLLVKQKVNFIEFFTAILAVMFGALGVAQVNADFNAQQEGTAAANRIFQIIDEPLDDMDPFGNEGEKPSSLDGRLEFAGVTFAYPTRPNNLIYYPSSDGEHDGFSLSVQSKESVAFVGKSGCGKSTALQIFLRFYNVTSGQVTLDGRDLRSINISWLRGQIGYVGQMPVLFAGTVRQNILLGKQDATDEEIRAAAKAANADEFIMKMSSGYDSEIGSGGSLLSGGQRQRIAIARAIVSDPKMLVLDEATSALDNESERIVQAALDSLRVNQPRTTLVVAHRLGTVRRCDKIAVLGRGGVQELGNHSELLKLRGLYHELWLKQGATEAEGEEEEEEDIKNSLTKEPSRSILVGTMQ